MGIRTRQRLTTGDGQLSRTFTEAMRLWDAMKTDGISLAERLSILTKTLRAAWPFVREWHYLCERCDDSGLVLAICRRGYRCNGISMRTDGPGQLPGKYRRLCAMHPDSDYEHEYGTACWCAKGHRFSAKQKAESEDFTAATKVRQPTRIGR